MLMVGSGLAQGLRQLIKRVSGAGLVDKDVLRGSLRELQRTLISADVNVKLVLSMTKKVEERMLSEDMPHVNQKEKFVKIVYEELVALMGEKHTAKIKPQKILLCGTYGHGKTTTSAKLAMFYSKRGLRTAIITTDTWRPAAYEQVEQLAAQVKVPMFGIKGEKDAPKILKEGLKKFAGYEVVIVDSAGRDSLNSELISEIKELDKLVKPDEKYLVLGADMGQTAGKQAKAFGDAIGVTGVILTRVDSSAKGGGAISACAEAGAPITFMGTGEKPSDFELFDAEQYVSRLLGFPDLGALLEKVKEAAEESELTEEDLLKGDLDLNKFYKQLEATKKMGSMSKVVEMLGMSAQMPKELVEQSEEKMKSYKFIIDSCTKEEKKHPEIIKKARIERIAKGSGCPEKEVRELLKQFEMTKKMFGKVKKGKRMPKQFAGLMKQFKGMGMK